MDFPEPLRSGRLVRRYKRFLADVVLDTGGLVTAHCPNTGAMTGLAQPGSRVWLCPSTRPGRKLAFTWELVETAGGGLACVHSARANGLLAEALALGSLPEFSPLLGMQREIAVGDGRSRLDFGLELPGGTCWVEVKSVTFHREGGVGLFPDAVSERARRHLQVLMAARRLGYRGVAVFIVMHSEIDSVQPAEAVDPVYAQAERRARAEGVEFIAYRAALDIARLSLADRLPFLPGPV